MKISLITYHHSTNYGAMLQTYATCKILKGLGHTVEIIDLRQYEKKSFLQSAIFIFRDINFIFFRRKFLPGLTPHYKSLEDLKKNPPRSDCYIVGSDQVWNPQIDIKKIEAYFLGFGDKNVRRISYASSFGTANWTIQDRALLQKLKGHLNNFNSVSVRENSGVEICKNIFNKNTELVLDPSLLFDNYEELTGRIFQKNEIVCYKLVRDSEFFTFAKHVSNHLNIPLKMLNNAYPIKGFKYVYPPSMRKWIRTIAGAKFVITDSFHGVALSILFQKNFVVLASRPKRITRIQNILELLGIKNRLFFNLNELKNNNYWDRPIDYSNINHSLRSYRMKSIGFLENALY